MTTPDGGLVRVAIAVNSAMIVFPISYMNAHSVIPWHVDDADTTAFRYLAFLIYLSNFIFIVEDWRHWPDFWHRADKVDSVF